MLSEILSANQSKPRVAESEWRELVHAVARRDQFALRALYERTHRLVFTLIMRMARDSALAADATVDVFCEVWRDAANFPSSDASVLGWVMNLARNRAVDHQRRHPVDRLRKGQERRVEEAIAHLTRNERMTIEAAFFSDSTYIEVGAALELPLEMVRRQIDSGMAHLARDLNKDDTPVGRSSTRNARCAYPDFTSLYALRALPPGELFRAGVHIAACPECRDDLKALHRVIDLFAFWPTELLRPSIDLWACLSKRIASENRCQIKLGARRHRPELPWEHIAPGVQCKLLAADADKQRLSMLVRLAPGAEYPPLRHAGIEELHLLHGEVRIDGVRLQPGDFNRAERGPSNARVRSEPGCTFVLITSRLDEPR